MQTTVQIDENGDQFVVLPKKITEQLGWNEHTTLNIRLDGKNVVIEHKTEWNVEDAQEHLEAIIDDVSKNDVHHFITDDKGRRFVIIPYND